jgi:putative transposase
MPRTFAFFRPEAPVAITRRNLPHWEQADVWYFLTFRTADSLPEHVMGPWLQQRNAWLKGHGIDPTAEHWHAELALLPEKERREFHGSFSRKMHEMLDACHGACVLRRPDVRQIAAEAMMHFDEDRYRLGGYVVMPNHVHALVQCLGETRLKGMGYSWKHYSAREINKVLGEKNGSRRDSRATFWQGETYDHIVRSREQFVHYRRYIEENPVKAKLREGEYALFFARGECLIASGVLNYLAKGLASYFLSLTSPRESDRR